jgi:multidrug efflux system outer membrane protein
MKNKNSIIAGSAVLLSLLSITSCKVSKDVAKPDMGLPATYAASKGDTTSVASMPWNTFFADPELKTLINEAILHNNDLQLTLKDIEAANLTLKQAKLGNIPTVGLQATANTSRPSDNSLNGLSLSAFNYPTKHIEDYTIDAYLSWEADLWGKIKSQKAAALAAYLETSEAKKAIQTRLVSDVAKGYYNLLMLDKQLGVAKKNALLNDSTLTMIKLQFDAGQVTSLAVQQAQAQKLEAESLVPQFEQAITVQEDALSILTGSLPRAIEHNENLSGASFAGTFGAGIPTDLLSRRPDVKAAELEVSAENGKVGYAKAFMYPSLTITAQGGLDAIKASNWFNIPASLFGTVAGSILQPLFQQKKLRTAWEVEKVHRDQSVIKFRQSVLVAVGEVSDNLVKIDKLQQQQNLSAERVNTLQLATSNSKQLFGNGLATYLEVITAQSNALQGELELANVQKAVLDAKVDLYRSVGGGWQ